MIQLSRIDIYVAFSQNTLRANVTPLHYLDNSRDKSRKTRIFQRASYLSHIQINFKDKNELPGKGTLTTIELEAGPSTIYDYLQYKH